MNDYATALQSGKIKFEIKSLANESTKQSYGGTMFQHTAVVVASGDPAYTKLPYLLVYTVKRIGGGDPDSPRRSDEYDIALVSGGIGKIVVGGGYRTSNEKWEAERIELTPVAAFPAVAIEGAPIRED